MNQRIAIIGAGVSGLTSGVVLAENGYTVEIFAAEAPGETTSAVAAAMWYPYDAEPVDKVIPWALQSYEVFQQLSHVPGSGVSMIELRTFCRDERLEIPSWAAALGGRARKKSEFVMMVPLADTSIYLDYLQRRLTSAGGKLTTGARFERTEDVDRAFGVVINCAGIGARTLARDTDLEPHRGQVVVVEKLELSGAVVCDDARLMYAIPRTNDCIFGGTNELSDNRVPDPATSAAILAECSATLKIKPPTVLNSRVGLRPFRKSGVRVESDRTADGRRLIHNYGHGGSGVTLSWGCARTVLKLAKN